MPACTSRAAPSIFLERPNCKVMRLEPTLLDEVISVTSAMTPRCRSSGVATVVAIVSGLAPGICASTEIVGNSTCGNGDTGSLRKANRPASATPSVNSVVATGRSINGVERLTTAPLPRRLAESSRRRFLGVEQVAEALTRRPAEPVEGEVDD